MDIPTNLRSIVTMQLMYSVEAMAPEFAQLSLVVISLVQKTFLIMVNFYLLAFSKNPVGPDLYSANKSV